MRLPSRGAGYLDTSAIIYSVERNEPYFTPTGSRVAASGGGTVDRGVQ